MFLVAHYLEYVGVTADIQIWLFSKDCFLGFLVQPPRITSNMNDIYLQTIDCKDLFKGVLSTQWLAINISPHHSYWWADLLYLLCRCNIANISSMPDFIGILDMLDYVTSEIAVCIRN